MRDERDCGEWDINSAQLSLCHVGMTRQSDSSIVFRWKKPVKFARALHRDSVSLKFEFSVSKLVEHWNDFLRMVSEAIQRHSGVRKQPIYRKKMK